jgi:hypothetical protein
LPTVQFDDRLSVQILVEVSSILTDIASHENIWYLY